MGGTVKMCSVSHSMKALGLFFFCSHMSEECCWFRHLANVVSNASVRHWHDCLWSLDLRKGAQYEQEHILHVWNNNNFTLHSERRGVARFPPPFFHFKKCLPIATLFQELSQNISKDYHGVNCSPNPIAIRKEKLQAMPHGFTTNVLLRQER